VPYFTAIAANAHKYTGSDKFFVYIMSEWHYVFICKAIPHREQFILKAVKQIDVNEI